MVRMGGAGVQRGGGGGGEVPRLAVGLRKEKEEQRRRKERERVCVCERERESKKRRGVPERVGNIPQKGTWRMLSYTAAPCYEPGLSQKS